MVFFIVRTEKLIKTLPSLVPSEDVGSKGTTDSAKMRASDPSSEQRPESPESSLESSSLPPGTASLESLSSPTATGTATAAAPAAPAAAATEDLQHHGDSTGEESRVGAAEFLSETAAAADPSSAEQCKEELGKSPGEIAFFKLLHTEFRKASYFFEKAQTEFEIREERVREGMNIMKQPNSILVNEKWSMLAKSIFRLYKDLLLLETYAIMAYCSFSKILKKHDKVTGHNTRSAFMVRYGERKMQMFNVFRRFSHFVDLPLISKTW